MFSDKGDPNHHNSKHTVRHRPRSLCDFLYIFTIPVSRAVPLFFFAIRWHAKFCLSYLFSSSPLVCIHKYTYTLSFLLFDFGVRTIAVVVVIIYVHASVCSLFNDHHITMLPVTSIQHNGAVDTYLHNFYFIFFRSHFDRFVNINRFLCVCAFCLILIQTGSLSPLSPSLRLSISLPCIQQIKRENGITCIFPLTFLDSIYSA